MGVPNRQIGWSQESNLLWYILSQLKRLTSIVFSLKEAATPKYKVYTALLTQSGGEDFQILTNSVLTVGVTYEIIGTDDDTVDFTNVGAPNNDFGTYFVATGTTPNSWGANENGGLRYNVGAPVVTVLENTIGNIWFTYDGEGYYSVNSNGLFTLNKTYTAIQSQPVAGNVGDGIKFAVINFEYPNVNNIGIITGRLEFSPLDNFLMNTPIEIRVYN